MSLKLPEMKIEEGHELTADEINRRVLDYQSELVKLNDDVIDRHSPGALRHDAEQAVADYKQRLLQSSKGVVDLMRRADEREEEQRKEQEAKAAAVQQKNKELAEANLAADCDHQRRLWVMAAGSEDGFEAWWKSEGKPEAIKNRMRDADRLAARVGVDY